MTHLTSKLSTAIITASLVFALCSATTDVASAAEGYECYRNCTPPQNRRPTQPSRIPPKRTYAPRAPQEINPGGPLQPSRQPTGHTYAPPAPQGTNGQNPFEERRKKIEDAKRREEFNRNVENAWELFDDIKDVFTDPPFGEGSLLVPGGKKRDVIENVIETICHVPSPAQYPCKIVNIGYKAKKKLDKLKQKYEKDSRFKKRQGGRFKSGADRFLEANKKRLKKARKIQKRKKAVSKQMLKLRKKNRSTNPRMRAFQKQNRRRTQKKQRRRGRGRRRS